MGQRGKPPRLCRDLLSSWSIGKTGKLQIVIGCRPEASVAISLDAVRKV
jgi:hypothetical protein